MAHVFGVEVNVAVLEGDGVTVVAWIVSTEDVDIIATAIARAAMIGEWRMFSSFCL